MVVPWLALWHQKEGRTRLPNHELDVRFAQRCDQRVLDGTEARECYRDQECVDRGR